MSSEIIAGLDIGNSTTEVVLARRGRDGIEILGTARAPTRRAKGSIASLDGALALVRRLERARGVSIGRAAVARLRPVQTLTAALPAAEADTGRLRVIGAGAGTAGGHGFAVGRPHRLGADPPSGTDPLVAVVPAELGYRVALKHLQRLAAAGRLVAVVLANDEAVLIGNRLADSSGGGSGGTRDDPRGDLHGGLPVVDEVDVAATLGAVLLAVEVAEPGSTLRGLTDPLRLTTALGLAAAERTDAARLARTLHDRTNAVVALSQNPRDLAQPGNAGYVTLQPLDERIAFAQAHARIIAGPVGLATGYALPPAETLQRVDDLWTADLSAVAGTVLARDTGAGARSIGLAALLMDAPLTDPSGWLAERLDVPVTVGTESRAGRAGALSTPGAPTDQGTVHGSVHGTVVIDLGGGTIDAVSSSAAVVAAGGGELLTASVAALTGSTGAAAEWVKRGPAQRLEAPQLLLGEDGARGFLDRPAPAELIGSLVVPGPAGLLAFSRVLAPGEWRALRLRLKVEAIGGNVLRALRSLETQPDTVIVVGGPAGDEEVLSALARALPDGVAIGRGNVAGTLGHRYAVAYGLLLSNPVP